MSTNALGKGTVNVTVNMPQHLKDELDNLAKKSGIKTGAYVRALLANYADQRATVGKPQVITTARTKRRPAKKP